MQRQARAVLKFARKVESLALRTSPIVTGLSIFAFGAVAAIYSYDRVLSEERARLLKVEAGIVTVLESRLAAGQRATQRMQAAFEVNGGLSHAMFKRIARINDGLPKSSCFVAVSYGVVKKGHGNVLDIEPLGSSTNFSLNTDPFEDRLQKKFITRARDTGLAALATVPQPMSKRTRSHDALAGDVRGTTTIIFAPLFRHKRSPPTVATRRAAFAGWIAVEFDTRELFAAAARDVNGSGPIIALDAFDGPFLKSSSALFSSSRDVAADDAAVSDLVSETNLTAVDRVWTLRTRVLPGYHAASAYTLLTELLLASMIFSVCVASFLSLARRRNATVERSERQLRLVMDSAPAMIAYIGADRRCIFANKTFEDWFGDAPSAGFDRDGLEHSAPSGAAERLIKIALSASIKSVDDALSGKQVSFESMVEVNKRGQRALRIELGPDVRADGGVAGFVFMAMDLSDEREAREELREETRALELIIEAGVKLRQELDADKIMRVVTDAALAVSNETGGTTRAAFFAPPDPHFISEPLSEASAIANEGWSICTMTGFTNEEVDRLRSGGFALAFGGCFQGQSTVIINDLSKDVTWSGLAKLYGEMCGSSKPACSLLISPVSAHGGRLFGQLAIVADVPHAFQERHRRIVESLAAQAAIALDNARLFKESRRTESAARRWAATRTFLADAGDALASTLDFMQALDGLARLATPRIADWCSVEVFDQAGDLRLACVSHADRERTEGARRFRARFPANRLGDPELETLLTSGRTQYRPAPVVPVQPLLSNDPDYAAFVTGLGIHSFVRVALKAQGKVFGVLTLANAESKVALAHEDVALAEDLARRISMSRENARLYREAREINRVKDEFLATLSHELRTPLNVIQGHSELLHDEAPDLGDLNESVDAIWRNARAQTRLVNDLLDVSSIITGKVTIRTERIAIVDAVRAAVDSIRFAAQAKSLTIDAQIPEATIADHFQIEGDPVRIQQILSNLLSNAVKFARDEGTIVCSVNDEGGRCRISVYGDGQGIDPEFLPHVFERFRQEDSSLTRRYGGLGLGLSIVQLLTELHGGCVEARSEGRGRGAEFVVWLPLVRPGAKTTEDMSSAASTYTNVESGESGAEWREARG